MARIIVAVGDDDMESSKDARKLTNVKLGKYTAKGVFNEIKSILNEAESE